MPVLHAMATALSWITGVLFRYRREVVHANLSHAFPEWDDTQRKKVLRRFYMHFTDTLVETFKLLGMRKSFLPGRIRVKNPEVLEAYFKQQRSVIAVGGHYGNWEWLGTALPLLSPYPVLAAYRPLSNAIIDRTMKQLRSIHGTRLIPDSQIYRAMKSAGEPVLTYLIADQTPLPENGYWMPFLHRETPVFLGPEKMGRATDAVIVFLAMTRERRGYYQIEVIPVSEHPQQEAAFAITHRHVALLEDEIRKSPSDWLWSHKRWKHQRPA